MAASDILSFHQAQPFEPFLIRIADGKAYTVDRPEFLGMSRSGNTLYFSAEDGQLITITVSQIASIEKGNSPRSA